LANWDVFHSDRLEVEEGLTTNAVRTAIARGKIRDDDMVRPAGTGEKWKRVGDVPDLKVKPAPAASPSKPATSRPKETPTAVLLDDLEEVRELAPGPPLQTTRIIAEDRNDLREQTAEIAEELAAERSAPTPEADESALALPVSPDEVPPPDYDSVDEDQEIAEFTLAARGGTVKEEDLDLAAMVDIAFQLIMFFLVTAASVYFKSMEIPPPDPEKKQQTAQAPQLRTLDELKDDNIIVEIDAHGQIMVDHEPIPASSLTTKLRGARDVNGRTTMLLMADLTTPHRNAVLAYDAAQEVGLMIKIGRPAEVAE
jgi:biopolymer transport protein ExbD